MWCRAGGALASTGAAGALASTGAAGAQWTPRRRAEWTACLDAQWTSCRGRGMDVVPEARR